MGSNETLSLQNWLELPHPSLPHPSRFTRLLCPIIGVLRCVMDHVRYRLQMCNSITMQFASHEFTASSISPVKLKNALRNIDTQNMYRHINLPSQVEFLQSEG